MENYAFKSVAFGGFDKQDVIHYIEQTAKEAAAVQERLQKENEDLQTEADSLRTQVRELPDAAGDGDRPPGAGPVRAGAGAHSPAGAGGIQAGG